MTVQLDRYITYEFAADYLDVSINRIDDFVAITGFPTKDYNMVHDSILVRYPDWAR